MVKKFKIAVVLWCAQLIDVSEDLTVGYLIQADFCYLQRWETPGYFQRN